MPTKCVEIKANLKNSFPTYRLCPNSEFSTGQWMLAITSICCEAIAEDINSFCTVSSNFCVSERYSASGQVEIYQQPLTTIYVNLKKNKSINRFTSPGTKIKLSMVNNSLKP